jgi:hypothetical protein
MNVVTIAAANKSFIHPMVVWLGEVSFGRCMASVTEFRLCLHQEVFGNFGLMRRVAVETANVIARMRRCRGVPLLVFAAMTA